MAEFPTTWSGVQGALETGIQQQQVNQLGQYQQGLLKIQQQAQQNQQQRDLFARADKQVSDIMGHVQEATTAALLAGNDVNDVAKKLQPMVDIAANLRKSAGGDDSAVRASFAAMLATPHVLTPAEAKPVVVSEDILGKTYNIYNPKTGRFDLPATSGEPAAPGQDNLVQPDEVPGSFKVYKGPEETSGALPTSVDPVAQKLISAGVLTQQSLDFQATRVADGAKITDVTGSGYGKLTGAIRSVIQKRAAEIAMARGQTPADVNVNRANLAAQTTSLNKMTMMKNSIEQFESTAVKNGERLVQLAQKVDKTGSPIIERWIRAGRRAVAGDVDVSNFNLQFELWKAEVAKIMTNPNITGVLTDSARREVSEAVTSASTYPQIKAATELLKLDFKNRSDAIDEQINTIKKSFSPTGKSGGKSEQKVIDWTDYMTGKQ